MSRYRFGGDAAAWIVDLVTDPSLYSGADIVAIPGSDVDVPLFADQSGATPATDLLDATGTPITGITVPAGSAYLPFFFGPNDIATLFFQDSNNAFHALLPSDLGDRLASAQNTIADLLDGTITLPGTGGIVGSGIQVVKQIATGIDGWTARPDLISYTFWMGTDKPRVGVFGGAQYMMDTDQFISLPSLLI